MFEEITRLVELLSRMGVSKVRLTGGEPLVRKDFPKLAAMLANVPDVHDLAVTTNGYLLERDAAALVDAGVRRFNMSIDSLQADRFFELTRRDALPRVMRGLDALATYGGDDVKIKLNAVALRDFTEDEALPFARYAREHPFEIRFIEFMPLDADHTWTPDQVLTGAEIREIIEREHRLEQIERPRSSTASRTASPTAARDDRVHQPGLRAVLLGLQPHPDHGRRQAAHLPVLAQRDGPAHADAGRRRRRRARDARPRGDLAQGAQAPGQRAGLHPARRAR